MARAIDTPPTGLHFVVPTHPADTARVEVCAFLDIPDGHASRPGTGTVASLKVGADGIGLRAATRSWYVPYHELEAHEARADGVLLRMKSGRCLELRTPAPHVLQRHLEKRITSYARHAILAQQLPSAMTATSPSSQLLSAFENPATAPEERVAIATWLGTRPLERGDALYLHRIVHDIADGDLAGTVSEALDLGA